jgi:hypothetical protein
MNKQKQFELDEEMKLLQSLSRTASIDVFCAMYYMALTVISDNNAITVVEAHNDMIIEGLNEHSGLFNALKDVEENIRH